jgi:hypothetical protein
LTTGVSLSDDLSIDPCIDPLIEPSSFPELRSDLPAALEDSQNGSEDIGRAPVVELTEEEKIRNDELLFGRNLPHKIPSAVTDPLYFIASPQTSLLSARRSP